jgi:hypothetical protein
MASRDKFKTLKTKERKLRKHKDLLLQSVQGHILPFFIDKGFAVGPQSKTAALDRKSASTFPFELRRVRPDAGVDLVEIQFMTYQRAAFRINAGVAPREGLMTATGHWPAEEVCVHWLSEFFEMYASRRWRRWFCLWLWRFRTPLQSDYDKLALRISGFLPEVELALREGKLGPHMRRVAIHRRPPVLTPQGTAPRS